MKGSVSITRHHPSPTRPLVPLRRPRRRRRQSLAWPVPPAPSTARRKYASEQYPGRSFGAVRQSARPSSLPAWGPGLPPPGGGVGRVAPQSCSVHPTVYQPPGPTVCVPPPSPCLLWSQSFLWAPSSPGGGFIGRFPIYLLVPPHLAGCCPTPPL